MCISKAACCTSTDLWRLRSYKFRLWPQRLLKAQSEATYGLLEVPIYQIICPEIALGTRYKFTSRKYDTRLTPPNFPSSLLWLLALTFEKAPVMFSLFDVQSFLKLKYWSCGSGQNLCHGSSGVKLVLLDDVGCVFANSLTYVWCQPCAYSCHSLCGLNLILYL